MNIVKIANGSKKNCIVAISPAASDDGRDLCSDGNVEDSSKKIMRRRKPQANKTIKLSDGIDDSCSGSVDDDSRIYTMDISIGRKSKRASWTDDLVR